MTLLDSIIIIVISTVIGALISVHYANKKIEEYKFLILKREKIANIASFFSKWIKYRGHEEKWLNDKEKIDYYEDLTKMSFEFALWIEDEDFLKKVMRRLRNEQEENIAELLLQARELINNKKNKKIKSNEITSWPKEASFLEKGPSE